MTWSVRFNAKTSKEAIKFIDENDSLPTQIQNYIIYGLEGLDDDMAVFVEGHGHLFTGEDGNYKETSATIIIKPIEWYK